MNTLRKPRLKSTVVSVAVETFFSASRLYDESMVEVAKEAQAQTEFEDWVEAKVKEGRSIFGLYPPNAETKAEFEAYKKRR